MTPTSPPAPAPAASMPVKPPSDCSSPTPPGLDRDDFSPFIHADPGITDPAAITDLTGGELSSSSGEQKMLRFAASLAG